MANEKREMRIPIMMTRGEVANIDRWRSREVDVPTRSEAIRRLVEKGLNID